MHSTPLLREQFDSTRAWARAEYARIQNHNQECYPRSVISQEPCEKSALFARLLSGKPPLPFPPPTSFNQPWYEVVEEAGSFDILLGGTLPAWDVPNKGGTVFLEYLIINACPWGVVTGNDAAAKMSELLGRLRDCKDRQEGEGILSSIERSLLQRPEWVVRFEPWPDYRVYLRRAKRQGKRRDIELVPFFRHTLDGTNLEITRVLIDGGTQLAGKAQRAAHLRAKPEQQLSAYERKVLVELGQQASNSSSLDWVEFEADTWAIEPLDTAWREKLAWFKQ